MQVFNLLCILDIFSVYIFWATLYLSLVLHYSVLFKCRDFDINTSVTSQLNCDYTDHTDHADYLRLLACLVWELKKRVNNFVI